MASFVPIHCWPWLHRLCQPARRDGRRWRLTLCGLSASFLTACLSPSPSLTSSLPPADFTLSTSPIPSPSLAPAAELDYSIHSLPQATVHLLRIPAQSAYTVTPVVAEELATVEELATASGAIAAINAGFFDPVNHLTTSYIRMDGAIVADPTQNDRLMTNPDLQAYLTPILNRTEFRRYRCETANQYAIAAHLDPIPEGCSLQASVGAGPRLLPELTLEAEAFAQRAADGTVVRDAIGGFQPNARTAIGLTASGEVLWVLVAQSSEEGLTGMTLPELADWMQSQGAIAAMNLDGGSSSTLWYDDMVIAGQQDAQGNPIQRSVKSALLLTGDAPHSP